MGVLRALLTEGSSHRMEVIIIALIAIEVTLALASHGYLGGEDHDEGEIQRSTSTPSQQPQPTTRPASLRNLFQFGA